MSGKLRTVGDDEDSGAVMDRAEALRFVTGTAWDAWVDNEEVRRLLTQLRDVTVRETTKEIVSVSANEAKAALLKSGRDTDTLKIVVVGDGAVGKTSLLVSYDKGKFPVEYVPTVFENTTKRVAHKGRNVTLLLFDTAGQEEYDRLRPLSYPGASIVLLCFSVANRLSFTNASSVWAPEVRYYLPRVPTLLVGLKTDLRDAAGVAREEGEELAKKIGAAAYMEACSKTQAGVSDVFEKAIAVCWDAAGGALPRFAPCSSLCASLGASLDMTQSAPLSDSMRALVHESILANSATAYLDELSDDDPSDRSFYLSDTSSDESDDEPLTSSLLSSYGRFE